MFRRFTLGLAIASLSASAALAGTVGVNAGGERTRNDSEPRSIVSLVVDQIRVSLNLAASSSPRDSETKARSKPHKECGYSGHPGQPMEDKNQGEEEEEKASGPEPMYFGF